MSPRRENFYRRNPGDALSGMVGMTLEERGVYNTIIDLIYLTWRPLEDNRAYIAGHCGCAVQKLNPIVRRLVDRGKLLRFEEDGLWYLSNRRFEDERSEVKGRAKTRSGRAEVGEKSAGVREKSGEVGENPLLLEPETEEKQSVEPLDRRRQEKRESSNELSSVAIATEGQRPDQVQEAFDAWNELARKLSLPKARSLDRSRRAAIGARLRDGGLEVWAEALRAVARSRHCRGENDRAWRADLDFVCQPKSWRRLLEGFYGTDAPDAPPDRLGDDWSEVRWAAAVELWRADGSWEPRLGPSPGQPGCRAPPSALINSTPRGAAAA